MTAVINNVIRKRQKDSPNVTADKMSKLKERQCSLKNAKLN